MTKMKDLISSTELFKWEKDKGISGIFITPLKDQTQEDENISLTLLGKHPPSDLNKTELSPLTVVVSYSVIVEMTVDMTLINRSFFISIHSVLILCSITTSFSSQDESKRIGASRFSLAGLASSSNSSMIVVISGSEVVVSSDAISVVTISSFSSSSKSLT